MSCQLLNRVWETNGTYVVSYGQPDTVALGFTTTNAKPGYLAFPDVVTNTSVLVYKDQNNWAIWPMCFFDRHMQAAIIPILNVDVETFSGELFDGDAVDVIQVPSVKSLAHFISQKGVFQRVNSLTTDVSISILGGTTQAITGSSPSNIYLAQGSTAPHLYGIGVDILPAGTGVVTVIPNSGVTLNGSTSSIIVPAFSRKTLTQVGIDAWVLT